MKKLRGVIVVGFSTLGLLFSALVIIGLIADFRAVDRTRGEYEPPYSNYTGTPIDWNDGDLSNTGFVLRGRVANTLLNCTSGLLEFEIYGVKFEYRKVSQRAIVVHKPREACVERGFTPQF